MLVVIFVLLDLCQCCQQIIYLLLLLLLLLLASSKSMICLYYTCVRRIADRQEAFLLLY